MFAITSVFTVNNLIAFSLSTAARARVARVLAADLSARALNRAFCALLARVALWMLLG